MGMIQRWKHLNEWLRAFVLAALALLLLHQFVFRFVSVRSTSMYATLLPGDLVGVTRLPVWTGFARGDIAVFRDPVQDDRAMLRRQLLIKRIVGLPGDTVQLIEGRLFVNRERIGPFPDETQSYLVRLNSDSNAVALVRDIGLPLELISGSGTMLELPLNKAMAAMIRERDDVISAEPMRMASGAPRHIFPFSPYFEWNSDDYGPIIVPKRGRPVSITPATIPLYDRLISRYEGHELANSDNDLLIDGEISMSYVVEQDYYFVLGDSRHHSADSRYWGFVPADHLVGRAAIVLLSSEQGTSGPRWGRALKGL